MLMIHFRLFCICITAFLLLIGCTPSNEANSKDEQVDYTKIAAKTSIEQKAANQVKKKLANNKDVKAVHAVNANKKLVIAVDVPHSKRFRLAKIRTKLTKELKKEFDKYQVVLSTDKKILLELEQLEKKINDGSISNKQLDKEAKRIISLSKEQT